MTARWSDPHRLPGPQACCDPGYARAVTPYPTRGARRRRKPTILACLHQTANAHATAVQERDYANRAGSAGPSATA